MYEWIAQGLFLLAFGLTMWMTSWIADDLDDWVERRDLRRRVKENLDRAMRTDRQL